MLKFTNMKTFLQDYHDQVMGHEEAALKALANGDNGEYNTRMRQKAEMMADIVMQARPYMDSVPVILRSFVEENLLGFASSARMGLKLNSPFYWSALLWKDDAKPGDQDNLAIFISHLPVKES